MWKRILIAVVAIVLVVGASWSARAQKEETPAVDEVKARLAHDVFAQLMARWKNNQAFDIENLELWSAHILEADLDLAHDAEQRVAAYEGQIKRTAELAVMAKSFAATGQSPPSDALAAEYYRLQAVSQAAKAH